MSKLRTFGLLDLLLAGAMLCTPGGTGVAQRPAGASYSSYTRAAAIVARAAAAHGGDGAVRSLRTMAFSWEGESFPRTQGRRAAALHDVRPEARPLMGSYAVDLPRSRGYQAIFSNAPGDIRGDTRLVANGREFFSYDRGQFFGGTSLSVDSTGRGAEGVLLSINDAMPVLLVRQALAASATLRYVGTDTVGPDTVDVVTFASSQGSQTALRFDRRTGLLDGYERIADDPVLGDVVARSRFTAYEQVQGLLLPKTRTQFLNGEITLRQRLTAVTIGEPFPDSVLQRPAGYTVARPNGPPGVVRAGDGVYFVERLGGGYRTMFVDTSDGIVVLDAPLNSAVTEQAIQLIQQTLPGRPIRYVALTHHHGDHVGGLRSYVARGAIVVTAPGTEEYVRELVSAIHTTTVPDSLARAPRDLQIETVSGRRTIGTGPSAVELINPGPTSHAEGMLLAYVPSRKLLFQGDFLRINANGGPARGTGAARDLVAIIGRLRLEVEHIAAVHGENGTVADLAVAAADPGPWR